MSFFRIKSKIFDKYGDKKKEDSQEYFAYYLIRPISFWVAPLFAIFNVSANSVTWLSLIFGLLGLLRFLNINNCLSSVTGASKDHCSGKIFKMKP